MPQGPGALTQEEQDVRVSFLDLIKLGDFRLKKVNKDEPLPPPPVPKGGGASPGDHMSELLAKIRQRGQSMAGKDISEKRALLNLAPQEESQSAIVETPGGMAFAMKDESSDADSDDESSESSEWNA